MEACPKCGAAVEGEDQAFCERCGERFKEGVRRKKVRRRLGSLAGEQHKKHIKNARIAIAVVGVLNLVVGGLALFAALDLEDDPRAIPEMVTLLKMVAVATLVVGGVFMGLFFWAKHNPFAASLTALVIYLTLFIVNIATNPTGVANPIGLLIAMAIILALVSGVKSGLAHKRLTQSE